jgi:sugar lactone lactonase YvrE
MGCALALLCFCAIGVPVPGQPPLLTHVVILAQPRSVTTPLGSTVLFSVQTNAYYWYLYGYQWRHNGQTIPGATSLALTVSNIQLSDAGRYDVVVTGLLDGVTSSTAILSIGQPIQFVVQPQDASVVVGSSAAFHVEVTGDGPFTYQWLSNSVLGVAPPTSVEGPAYQGATTPTLVVGPASLTSGSTQYICEVTDAHGSPVRSRAARQIGSDGQCLTMTPLAGLASTVGGSADGTGNAARFYEPGGIVVDAAGNLYVADSGNHTIRKVTSSGLVTTLAGTTGSTGSKDGIGSAAWFYDPEGIAADATGNLYVADGYSIRKITPAGVVTTLAGSAENPGSSDGTGDAARFYGPNGIAVDAVGNLFVADTYNQTIRKITPAGVVTTFAGTAGSSGNADGVGATARFYKPFGIALDAAGNLFVADALNSTIRKITPAGSVTTLAGSAGNPGGSDGTGSVAHFYWPYGIALDADGILYVTDGMGSAIRKITPTGVVTTLAGGSSGSTDGVGSSAQFSWPWGIAVGANGTVFVADTSNNVIRQGVPTTLASRVSALSARGLAGTGDQTLIAGLISSGEGNKQLLLRGIGPGLASFGVSGVVADPVLTLFNSAGSPLQQNNDWGGTQTLINAFAQAEVFPLSPNSKDAALLTTLSGGTYTAHLTTAGGTGVALLEAYDADPGTPTTRLAGLSARDQVGTGDNILIAGFIITGNVSRTVLIRGIGPALAHYGVSGVLANPQLQVFQGSTLLAQNDDWGNDITLATVAAQVNAFALDANSKDAALLLTLPPGAYTAQVSGVGNTTGVALVEIYEVP